VVLLLTEPDGTVTTEVHSEEKEQDAIQAQADYGRWQLGEINFQGDYTQNRTTQRAFYIISGPPGLDPFGTSTGLRFPLWRFNLTWFAHDVPRVDDVPLHIRPGYLVNIILHVMGTDDVPLIRFLPLRSMTVTFPQVASPGETWVQFQGEFGISYSDSRHLWKYLRQHGGMGAPQQVSMSSLSNSSTSSAFGDFAAITPLESPDGSRTVFTFALPLLASTVRVHVNGLTWRRYREYDITGPGEITFTSAPAADDELYIEARTGLG
jgi:hypothetical protein